MKRIWEAFRAARKIEIVLVVVFLAVLTLIMLEQGGTVTAGASSEEMRLERILSRIEGAGRTSVMISGEEGQVKSCVIVSDGADDMRVLIKIQRAVQAAMDIQAENIEIIPSGG